jgi:RNA polymerase sigma-70 factor (ECF subfamily)
VKTYTNLEPVDALFVKYFALLVIYSKRIVHSYDVAEDIVQEVFLKLWEKNPEGRYSRAYIFACVHNLSINQKKREKGKESINEQIPPVTTDEFHNAGEVSEEFERIRSMFRALDKLPPKSLEVLKKIYLEEKKYADVAKEMGLSLNTIKAHMYMSIKTLRKYMLLLWLFILDFYYHFIG